MEFPAGLTTKQKADELKTRHYWIGDNPRNDVVENLYSSGSEKLLTSEKWNDYGDANKAWDKQNRKALGLDKNNTQNSLLKSNELPEPIRERIQNLLKQGYRDCQTSEKTTPRNCFETAAYVSGLDFIDHRTKGVGDNNLLEDAALIDLLSSSGYKKTMEFVPFIETQNSKKIGNEYYEDILSLNNLSDLKALKPGDILLFGSNVVTDRRYGRHKTYIHASVYLGEYNGDHYIFEKPSYECGPKSTYKISSLTSSLEQNIGYPSVCDNCYDTIFVYRK